ncbi:Sporulation related domain-containing protein [Pedococcus cremeus]|uniref:Sporulation related domain-containing protein n=2 Tax=Pedococcus cremeus TaxID=587636 RepID=A0A1H9XRZ0_9MICO|nr:Sporulation related domain-containing protein [Pedococcus cremeus]
MVTSAATVLALGGVALGASSAQSASSARSVPSTGDMVTEGEGLPLGLPGLPETRSTTVLQPGVTLTRIERGAFDVATPWVVELSIPSSASSPDPDAPPRSVQDEASAQDLVRRLDEAGFDAEAQPVRQPAVADVPAGVIGYRVRLTDQFASKSAADQDVARLKAAGFSGRSWYSGWDGGSLDKGHWAVNVLTVDPRTFRGDLGGTFGPDLENRETTTALSAYAHAKAAVNAGFFVLDPNAGAPGDPAGVGVYDGALESEMVAGRPALVLHETARHTAVVRPEWRGTLRTGGKTLRLDGLNRVPGLIRNCGGDPSDQPTFRPLHDVTCTDPDELVAFTPVFGASTPSGPGAEVVLDRQDRVVRVMDERGTVLGRGERSVQGTGSLAEAIARLRQGEQAQLRLTLTTPQGGQLVRPGVNVINGGPQLLRSGALHITQAQDGMVHPGDPSFAYGWVLQRNPRTFAGVDGQGRTLLVTVDGRQPDQLGLSIPETAQVSKALGMQDAINLDGGGSTAMASDGRLISHPSDATGERPVGDAIYIR